MNLPIRPFREEAWRKYAECMDEDPHIFFPDPGRSSKKKYDQARLICAQCPVRIQCLDYAMEWKIFQGMWGGMDPKQRIRIARKKRLRLLSSGKK